MRIFTQIILALALTVALFTWLFATWLLDEVRPRYLETMEETLVDTSYMLASIVSADIARKGMSSALENLAVNIKRLERAQLNAQIYSLNKTRINLRVYVVDSKGRLLFDSMNLDPVGRDYSQWNDVFRALKGEYGARASEDNVNEPGKQRLYIAAPLIVNGQMAGVLTVGKRSEDIGFFMRSFKNDTIKAAVLIACCALVIGCLIVFAVIRQLDKITGYVKRIGTSEQVCPPVIRTPEIKRLLDTFEEMRLKLEGRDYARHYVQELTHAMKSPLSGLSGAAELLGENMPQGKLHKLIQNISTESERLKTLVEKMLDLSSLELCDSLENMDEIDLSALLRKVCDNFAVVSKNSNIPFSLYLSDGITVFGDEFLLREAISSLIENALDFSGENEVITIRLENNPGAAGGAESCRIEIIDNGEGIPQYAVDKIFQRFYSLPRPNTTCKSTGLGLAFARKIIQLHSGSITVLNRDGQRGVCAVVCLPVL